MCCGSCGYINCPTQLLGQQTDKAGQSPVAGQLGGDGARGGADFVIIKPAVFGASVSDVAVDGQPHHRGGLARQALSRGDAGRFAFLAAAVLAARRR